MPQPQAELIPSRKQLEKKQKRIAAQQAPQPQRPMPKPNGAKARTAPEPKSVPQPAAKLPKCAPFSSAECSLSSSSSGARRAPGERGLDLTAESAGMQRFRRPWALLQRALLQRQHRASAIAGAFQTAWAWAADPSAALLLPSTTSRHVCANLLLGGISAAAAMLSGRSTADVSAVQY